MNASLDQSSAATAPRPVRPPCQRLLIVATPRHAPPTLAPPSMSILTWLADQKLSDWVQGIGSLAAAGAAVGIALRQERMEQRRAEGARGLRRRGVGGAR